MYICIISIIFYESLNLKWSSDVHLTKLPGGVSSSRASLPHPGSFRWSGSGAGAPLFPGRSIPALHVLNSHSWIIHPGDDDYVLNMHWKFLLCAHFVCICAWPCVCVCAHVSNWGAETKEVSGWISPPHHWGPRELHHHHHLHSRDTLTRLLEADKACSINNSHTSALLIYLMWLNATEWADGIPACQHRPHQPSLGPGPVEPLWISAPPPWVPGTCVNPVGLQSGTSASKGL